MDTPIFPDPFCPLGTCIVVNSRYTGLYMSEYAPMTFSGFESQIPVGQISDIGVLIRLLTSFARSHRRALKLPASLAPHGRMFRAPRPQLSKE
jgi:hypothetical protein